MWTDHIIKFDKIQNVYSNFSNGCQYWRQKYAIIPTQAKVFINFQKHYHLSYYMQLHRRGINNWVSTNNNNKHYIVFLFQLDSLYSMLYYNMSHQMVESFDLFSINITKISKIWIVLIFGLNVKEEEISAFIYSYHMQLPVRWINPWFSITY